MKENFCMQTIEIMIGSEKAQFVFIPPGEFMMGSPEDEPGRSDDEILHNVTLTKGFYMQTTLVTKGQWRVFVEETGFKTDAETGDGAYYYTGSGDKSSDKKTRNFVYTDTGWKKDKRFYWENPGFPQTDDHPAICISWNDAQAFIKWLNTGAEVRGEGCEVRGQFRLPTEAEWEYACRAGTQTAYSFGNDAEQLKEYGWFAENSEDHTHPVRQLKPNLYGLYDMHGNVWECCEDRCDDDPEKRILITDTYRDKAVDPVCRNGLLRIFRGGGWYAAGYACRSAYRYRGKPATTSTALGFRLVKC
jgi:formylglycine-generating enzyme